MPRKITVAAVQMDANPAPTAGRLARAEKLVAGAAGMGAQLVVLPELFNLGYAYTPANYERAEPQDGPTTIWMRETAARLRLHLAGSLLLWDGGEIYNALLLFAPDGRVWRYDKRYPWGWERAYFRKGRGSCIAHTDLGDLGMLICWDVAHIGLWREYAGRVDLMLISSCPPDVSNPTYSLPGGKCVTPSMGRLKGDAQRVFGDMVDQQSAWLGVPAVCTVGSGRISTPVPSAHTSLLSLLPMVPELARYLPQAHQIQMICDLAPGCKVVDASGRALTELLPSQGEAFAIARVTLADEIPSPRAPQPPAPISRLTYLASDVVLPALTRPVYRRALHRARQNVSGQREDERATAPA